MNTLLLPPGQEHSQKEEKHRGSLFQEQPSLGVEAGPERGVVVQMMEHMEADLHSMEVDEWGLVRRRVFVRAKKMRSNVLGLV